MTDNVLPPAPPSASGDSLVRHLSFLAAAGELLSSSLDYEQTLQHLARLAVPALGDLCIVDIIEDDTLRRVATAHVSPAKTALLEDLRRLYPATGDSPAPAGRVIRSGQAELLADVTPDVVASHTRDPQHAALIRAIGIRSHLAAPLVARGTICGAISIGITESDRQYGQEDLALLQDLARRAALAVDNAGLYRRAQEEIAERRRAEESLRLSEGRFRAIMEQSPLSTQIFNAEGLSVRANRAWEELWGVRFEDLPAYNILEDRQLEALGIAPLVRRAFAGERVDLPLVRYDPNETIPDQSRHDDPVRWVRAFAYPVKDGEGRVLEVVLVHEDVTRVQRATTELQVSEERLRLALAAGRMNVWDWDLIADRVECSENAREFWGIDVGRPADFIAAIHPDDHAHVEAAGAAALRDGSAYVCEYRLLAPDGRTRWVQSRGRIERTPDGRPARILGVTVDISDLKAAEESTRLLADAGETLGASLDYRSTLRNLARAIVPRLADWCAVDLLNEAGVLERESVAHPDPARVELARELFEKYPPRPGDPIGAWHVIRTGEAEWAPEIPDDVLRAVAHSDEHYALISALDLRSYICVPLVARGAAIGVLTLVYAESGRRYRESDLQLVKDVGRRVAAAVDNARLYQQLRLEDRRKDEFLATLAHELRNPLAPIRTGLALLRAAPDTATAERTQQVMERQLTHMVRLIDDLLDLSRVTRGKVTLERERIELASIVSAALEASRPLIEAAGLQLTVRLPGEPVLLDADRTRLAQVLSNLLNNAAKYTERGGRVDLSAEVAGPEVVIRVADTGVGIPREMLSVIFEMFAQVGRSITRSQGGLGIGLTLVQRLVELHGGRVRAESGGLGAGSTFVVQLPIAAGAAPAEAAAAEHVLKGRARARRVLVVDDNADAADTLAELLRLDGHDVRTAQTATAALDLVRTFQPDVAFLDIGLPGMSGYDLARSLRQQPQLADLVLVAVTGWGQGEDRRQSRDAGFDHHLTKPVDPHEIQALVMRDA